MEMSKSTGLKPSCNWPRINAKYKRENNTEEPRQKPRVPGPWRICCNCKGWAEDTVVNTQYKGYTCFKCLGIKP